MFVIFEEINDYNESGDCVGSWKAVRGGVYNNREEAEDKIKSILNHQILNHAKHDAKQTSNSSFEYREVWGYGTEGECHIKSFWKFSVAKIEIL